MEDDKRLEDEKAEIYYFLECANKEELKEILRLLQEFFDPLHR